MSIVVEKELVQSQSQAQWVKKPHDSAVFRLIFVSLSLEWGAWMSCGFFWRQAIVSRQGWRVKKTLKVVSSLENMFDAQTSDFHYYLSVTPSGGSETGPRDSASPAVPAIDRWKKFQLTDFRNRDETFLRNILNAIVQAIGQPRISSCFWGCRACRTPRLPRQSFRWSSGIACFHLEVWCVFRKRLGTIC